LPFVDLLGALLESLGLFGDAVGFGADGGCCCRLLDCAIPLISKATVAASNVRMLEIGWGRVSRSADAWVRSRKYDGAAMVRRNQRRMVGISDILVPSP
jgi:hypothetical protein